MEVNNHTTLEATKILYVECKKKDGGIDQNTFRSYYGDYVNTSQKT